MERREKGHLGMHRFVCIVAGAVPLVLGAPGCGVRVHAAAGSR
jgi:hypothetical protein